MDKYQDHILVVFSSRELGGTERSITRMVNASVGDIRYTMCSLDCEGPWSEWATELGIKPIILGRCNDTQRHGQSSLTSYLRLLRLIKRLKPQVVYIFGVRATLLVRIIRAANTFKLVQGVRWNPASKTRLDRSFRFIEAWLSGLVDGYICNSKIAAETVTKIKGVDPKKIRVVYNGIELPPTIPYAGLQKTDLKAHIARPSIIVIANLTPRKGHIDFLHTIKDVVERIPKAMFYFIGRDDMDGELQRQVLRMGLERHIEFTGFEADLSNYYRNACLTVLPSKYGEGCPTSILESMAYGVPVVAFSVDGIPELVSDRNDGLLVPKERVWLMAEYIITLVTNQGYSQRLGEAGMRKVSEEFTLSSCATQHELIFKELLEQHVE